MEPTIEPRRVPGWLFPILLLGLGLRLLGWQWGQAYSHFSQGDGLEAYSVAVDYSHGEPRAQYIGQPNYNAHSKLPGPLWTMFGALGLRLGGSIHGVILEMILLNTVLIFVVFLLAERTVGRPGSFWATLLTATLPFPVYYSVAVYNPNVMAFLGALLFLALWSAATKPRSMHIFWVGLLLPAMPQFHMSGLMLIPTVAAVLWLAGARVSVPWLVAGLLAGLALYVPYVRGEMASGWQNTHGMMAGGGGHSWDGLKALTLPINLLLNWVPQWNRTFADYKEFGRACFGGFPVLVILNLLSVGVGVFLVAGAFLQIRTATRGFWAAPRRAWVFAPGPLFLTVLIVIPLFFVLVSGKPFHARYGLVLMAPILILSGNAAARWTASVRLGKQFRAALIALVLVNVWFMPAFYHHQQTRIEQGQNFVASFRQLELVYQRIKAQAGAGQPVRVDITAYIQGFPRSDEVHREAGMIRRYVEVREKEIGVRLSEGQSPSTYELLRADQVTTGDPRIAYQAHGIALVGPVATPNVK